ncbi:protein-export chaperone SecB [Desulfovibrio psychrotolerans]|uniref:Protein-export protein SecB n=1 Tax=Desulfovibrio psychrotolerans TaxID=415242 RepID=A0A7J0BX49_9BACT|nr:protein-export chaperone SecB [Desulfovibrio psychrotolerans]GFM38286.1 hypothetical protein DSM19430T_29700 [Desulfovibrio psychrotolerans]
MHIIDIRLLSCRYSNTPDKKDSAEDLELEIQCGKSFNEKKKIGTFRVKVRNTKEDEPYSFMLEYGGKFKFEDVEIEDQETFDRLQNVNIPAIIYPYIREHLADLCRRAGSPPVFLPPVNFVKLAKIEQRTNN